MIRLYTAILLIACVLCGTAKEREIQTRHFNKQTGLSSNQVNTLVQDHHGYIWAGTAKGLNRIDGHEIFTWDSPQHPLYKSHISDLLTDPSNNALWIFTPNGLLGCIDLNTFKLILHRHKATDSLHHHHLGKSYLWQFGTAERCSRTRLNKGQLVTDHFPHKLVAISTDDEHSDWLLTDHGLYLNGFEKKLPCSDSVTHIAAYRNICLALTPHEILTYNHSRRVARRTPIPSKFNNIRQCTELATWGNQLLIFTPERTLVYQILDGTFAAPSNCQIRNGRVVSANNGTVYAYDGRQKILCFEKGNNVSTFNLPHKADTGSHPQRLPLTSRVNDAIEAFSTYGNGLLLANGTNGKINHYHQGNSPNLIRDNYINALLTDHTECLWMATAHGGITHLRLADKPVANDSTSPTPTPPIAQITCATVDGEKRLIDGDKMELSYTHNNVTWHFSAMTYDRIEQTIYQYYLSGHDSTWLTPTTDHRASYKDLPPGEHRLYVRASFDGTHWGKTGSHTIVIGEPWWKQWPAFVAVLVLFVAMGLFLYMIVHRFIHPDHLMNHEPPTETADHELPAEPHTPEPALSAKDERFKQLLNQLMEENIERTDFGVEEFAAEAHLKRTQFYTKVKRITGISPIELLRKAHLAHATKLLSETDLTIDEVRKRCGFSNSTTFYNYFKQEYGVTPRQYRQNRS